MGKPIKPPVDKTLTGNARDNRIYGDSGNDIISGLGGNDQLFGGGGNDALYGGDGDDRLYGQDGNDQIYGGTGRDSIDGGLGDDYIEGGDGDDNIQGRQGNDTIFGGAGNDVFYLDNTGYDLVSGGSGSDTFIVGAYGRADFDTILDYDKSEDIVGYSPNRDANAFEAGNQGWDVVTAAELQGGIVGRGQATIEYDGTDTVLRLYNADGDTNADLTLHFRGDSSQPGDLQVNLWAQVGGSDNYDTPGLFYPAPEPEILMPDLIM